MRKSLLTALFVVLTMAGVAKPNRNTPVMDLLERHSPDAAKCFVFEITEQQSNRDFFTISSTKSKVYISGNNNISLASALHFYLKNIIGVSLTANDMGFRLPKQLPKIAPIRKECEIQTRLYLNGESYKGERTYWGKEQWQEEIDRMALSGVNMVYMPVGASCAYKKIGVEPPMPSYYSWWIDGDYSGDSSGTPIYWYEDQYNLERFITSELQKWGIEIVAQGYNGDQKEQAKLYYDQYRDIQYFKVSTSTAAKLLKANKPNSVWLYDLSSGKASAQEVAALPREEVLIVGRYDNFLEWDKSNICGHHNFILRPSTEEAQENLYNRTYRNKLMFCGIELVDSDTYRINSNFINSYIWDTTTPYKDYIKIYVKQMYGSENPTIERAIEKMYNLNTSTERPIIYSEPRLPKESPNILRTEAYISALKEFAGEASKYANNANYQHDLILFTQTALYERCQELAAKMAHSIDTRSVDFFKKESNKFLSLILMLDKLCYTRPEFRYDKYLDMARSKGTSPQEQGIYEGDVRCYTTIWGDRYTSNMLQRNDLCYSPKSGILGDYYYNRWYLYIKYLDGIINNRIEGDIDFYTIGKEWSEQRNRFTEQAKSSPLLRAVEIINYL